MKTLFLLLVAPFLTLSAQAARPDPEVVLRAVREFHGGPGPWAIAGYRMGAMALSHLGLRRHDFRMSVVHRAPDEVQFTCVMDGIHAATGASVGKRALSLQKTNDRHAIASCFTDQKTGRMLRIRLRPEVQRAITDVPYELHEATSRILLVQDDDALFSWDSGDCL